MFKSSTPAIRRSLACFLRDERGTTAIEYAIIASGISIVIVGAVATLGTSVKGFYSGIASALK
jgi:pilus assembly protein Flp/PilA